MSSRRRTGFFAAESDAGRVKVRAHVIFEGKVQGVFFRATTQECARDLMLTGWVRNRADGTVEAVFEGEGSDVKTAVERCSTMGPPARVERCKVEFSDAEGEFEDFSIIG